MQPLIIAGAVATFRENVAGALSNYENRLVQVNTTTGNAEPITAGNIPLGVCQQKLNEGQSGVGVALLNSGGIIRMIQNAAINPNAAVIGVTTAGPTQGRVVTATAGQIAVGVKVGPATAGAAGDVIYVQPCIFRF